MEQVWIALIVAVASTTSPLLLAYLSNRNARLIKQEDYARQDKVAAQAAEAAHLLLAANERVAVTTEVTNSKLDVIHTLVNSNMTTAMQAEFDATVRELAMMREVIALKQTAGHAPGIDTLAAVKSTEDKITELRTALKDRVNPK